MATLAFSVASWPQTGHLTGTGMRPLTGSMSNLNFAWQLQNTLISMGQSLFGLGRGFKSTPFVNSISNGVLFGIVRTEPSTKRTLPPNFPWLLPGGLSSIANTREPVDLGLVLICSSERTSWVAAEWTVSPLT